MFIDAMVKVICTDSTLAGFYVYWDFDEMNSAILIEENDRNKNNRFEKKEYKNIEENAFSYCAKSDYFTVLNWEDTYHPITKVERFTAKIIANNRIQYSFYIPCNIPLSKIEGKKIKLFFEDPTMYVAFSLRKKLIQVNKIDRLLTTIAFGKVDYLECIYLTIKRKSS